MAVGVVRTNPNERMSLVDAALFLVMPYGNAHDYMMRGRLKGKKMKPKKKRRGWYVTTASVLKLKAELEKGRVG